MFLIKEMEFRPVPAGRYNLQKNRPGQNEGLYGCKGLYRHHFFPVGPRELNRLYKHFYLNLRQPFPDNQKDRIFHDEYFYPDGLNFQEDGPSENLHYKKG